MDPVRTAARPCPVLVGVHPGGTWIPVETVTVPGTAAWPAGAVTSTLIDSGAAFRLTATGTWASGNWSGGPEGDVNSPPQGGGYIAGDETPYGLLGRIGPGDIFYVGAAYVGIADGTGPISFTMNDVPGIFRDNSGAVRVTLEVQEIPEPGTLMLAGLGLLGLGTFAWRRRRSF